MKNKSPTNHPVKDVLIIEWSSATEIDALKLYDVQGKLLLNQSVQSMTTKQTMSTTNLSSGIYMLVIEHQGQIIPKYPLDVVVRENYTIKLQGTEIFTHRCSHSYIEDEKLSTEVILK